MSKSIIDKINEQQEQNEKHAAIAIETMADYKMAVNGIAATPNGKLFFKTLIKACDVFTVSSSKDTVSLIESNARRNIYLELIRPLLEPELKQEIENQ